MVRTGWLVMPDGSLASPGNDYVVAPGKPRYDALRASFLNSPSAPQELKDKLLAIEASKGNGQGDVACAAVFRPVCAAGVTYSNSCVAARAGHAKTAPGECTRRPK